MKIFNLSHMKMNIMYEWQIGISTLRLPYYTAHPNIVNVEVQKKKKVDTDLKHVPQSMYIEISVEMYRFYNLTMPDLCRRAVGLLVLHLGECLTNTGTLSVCYTKT